jgi:hypothetical protein
MSFALEGVVVDTPFTHLQRVQDLPITVSGKKLVSLEQVLIRCYGVGAVGER